MPPDPLASAYMLTFSLGGLVPISRTNAILLPPGLSTYEEFGS